MHIPVNVSNITFYRHVLTYELPLNCISVKRIIQNLVWHTLCLWGQKEQNHGLNLALSRLSSDAIPLSVLSHPVDFIYRCPLAVKLAKMLGQLEQVSASSLSQAIACQLFNLFSSKENKGFSPNYPLLEVYIKIVEPGYLDFQLSPRAIALWLQNIPLLMETKGDQQQKTGHTEDNNPFFSQYTHARCCSLLLLGEREGLIKLESRDFSQPIWQWLKPDPIPWLDSNLESANFLLDHPSETYLLRQFLKAIDDLHDGLNHKWWYIANSLSEGLLNFNAACRFLGKVKRQKINLSQARLGLIAINQFLLRNILQEKLKTQVLVEL